MNKPRQQHFCPKCHLKNFTDADGYVWAIPQSSQRTLYKAKPENVAKERDFYTLEVEDELEHDPYILEKAFAEIEGKANRVIDKIIKAPQALDTFLSKEEFGDLLSFVGLFAARTPAIRKSYNGSTQQINKLLMDVALANKERFVSTAKKAGLGEMTDEDYHRLKEFHQRNEYEIKSTQNSLLQNLLRAADTVTTCLRSRNWVLGQSSKYKFVSSDNPVVLSWTEPFYSARPPGFGLSNTQVILPLNPYICLVGVFEDIPVDIIELEETHVPIINSIIASRATNYLYSSEEEMSWMMLNDKIGGLNDYLISRTVIATSSAASDSTEKLKGRCRNF